MKKTQIPGLCKVLEKNSEVFQKYATTTVIEVGSFAVKVQASDISSLKDHLK